MKNFLFFLVISLTSHYICHGQNNNGNLNRVQAAKMAYITTQLNLTPEEAQRFWPVYNAYNAEIKNARFSYYNDEIGYESKIVEIRKRYQEQFRVILNNDGRANKVFISENNFRDLLKAEMIRRQQVRRMNGGPMRQPRF